MEGLLTLTLHHEGHQGSFIIHLDIRAVGGVLLYHVSSEDGPTLHVLETEFAHVEASQPGVLLRIG